MSDEKFIQDGFFSQVSSDVELFLVSCFPIFFLPSEYLKVLSLRFLVAD